MISQPTFKINSTFGWITSVSSNSPSNRLSISEAKEGVQPGDLGLGPKHCQMVWKAAAFYPRYSGCSSGDPWRMHSLYFWNSCTCETGSHCQSEAGTQLPPWAASDPSGLDQPSPPTTSQRSGGVDIVRLISCWVTGTHDKPWVLLGPGVEQHALEGDQALPIGGGIPDRLKHQAGGTATSRTSAT